MTEDVVRDDHTLAVSRMLAQKAAELLLEKKCEDVRILDVHKLTSATSFFVIATADSERKAEASYQHVVEELKKEEERPLHVEGGDSLHWVLIDYFDVVVHVFMPDERRFYDLESLWADAQVTEVEPPREE